MAYKRYEPLIMLLSELERERERKREKERERERGRVIPDYERE